MKRITARHIIIICAIILAGIMFSLPKTVTYSRYQEWSLEWMKNATDNTQYQFDK